MKIFSFLKNLSPFHKAEPVYVEEHTEQLQEVDASGTDYSAESIYDASHHSSPAAAAAAQEDDDDEDYEEEEKEAVSIGTKIKVIAALIIISFATYIAYWVQEPSQIQADILGGDEMVDELPAEEPNEMMVAFDPGMQDDVVEVSIVDFLYSPANITIEEGTTVIWTNMDTVNHTVTGDEFDSGEMAAGDSFAYTFEREGEFAYACTLHPEMTGQITVTAAAAPEEEVAAEEEVEEPMEEGSLDEIIEDELHPASVEEEDLDETMSASAEGEEGETLAAMDEEVHGAAAPEDAELATTGPEDAVYLLILAMLLYMNRKKIIEALRK